MHGCRHIDIQAPELPLPAPSAESRLPEGMIPEAFLQSIGDLDILKLPVRSGKGEGGGGRGEVRDWTKGMRALWRVGEEAAQASTLLLHCCHTVVTLLYTVVTLLLHCCYTVVTVVTLLSHCCHTLWRVGEEVAQAF
jgi:hypothetical protein